MIESSDVIIGDAKGTLKKTLKRYTIFNKIIRLFLKITIYSLENANKKETVCTVNFFLRQIFLLVPGDVSRVICRDRLGPAFPMPVQEQKIHMVLTMATPMNFLKIHLL
jgi:hypothetical protein